MVMVNDKAAVIQSVCEELLGGNQEGAEEIVKADYPFKPAEIVKRKYTPLQAMTIFVRDGFIDRYSGKRLVFPGILRLLSHELPEAFPFQEHWKMSETHSAYWELFPTIDHVLPTARGGEDQDSNKVCTSMLLNAAKGNWTLDELGWELHAPGDIDEWDGLVLVFWQFVKKNEHLMDDPFLKRWHDALLKIL